MPTTEEDALDLLQYLTEDVLRPLAGMDAAALAARINEHIRQIAGGREVRILSRRLAHPRHADEEPPRPTRPPTLHSTSPGSKNPDLIRLILDSVEWFVSQQNPALPMSRVAAIADQVIDRWQIDRNDLRYIPKGTWRRQRANARKIYDEFRTSTYAELAARWNLSEMRIRQIVNKFRRAEAAERKAQTHSLI
ncbi:Mor transcription activator family protein [Thauera butanivorans]|uniref:Mor transcription activator family protein n=1 Tax=Thauera butanivorans TaxID=86174 RepID=UPI000A04A91B|nr:Mor transcription activator family protein [Thauera butanivorans]